MAHIEGFGYIQMLQVDGIAVNLEYYRTAQKSNGQHEAKALLEAQDDSLDACQRSFGNSYLLTRMQKWHRLGRKSKLERCLQ